MICSPNTRLLCHLRTLTNFLFNASIMDLSQVVSVEDEMLQVAMKQSMAEHGSSSSSKGGGGNDDDEQYQAALKMSMANFGKIKETRMFPLSSARFPD